MSTENQYDRIKDKLSKDKVLQDYNETKSKLINEGYKPTEDKVLQQYNETRMKLLSEGYRTSSKIAGQYRQDRIKPLVDLSKEDSRTIRKISYIWFGILFSILFILILSQIN